MGNIFDKYYTRYDAWYDKNKFVYFSELEAVKRVLPQKAPGLEIGVGSGRFAAELGIGFGIEPAEHMAALAKKRGVNVVLGLGEDLPFRNGVFEYVVIIIALCFVKDAKKVLREAKRVLRRGGNVIIAIIDKNSFLGKSYRRKESVFYKEAKFFTPQEVTDLLRSVGFSNFSYYQTIFKPLEEINSLEEPLKGTGRGSFVVISGEKVKI